MLDRRKWASLINSRAAQSRFRFEELLGFRKLPAPHSLKHRDMDAVYNARARAATPCFNDTIGPSASTARHSPSARNEAAGDVDIGAWRVLSGVGRLQEVGRLWQLCLLGSTRMLVRNAHMHGGKWFFVLLDGGVPCRFGWPARALNINGEACFQMGRDDGLDEAPMVHIYDIYVRSKRQCSTAGGPPRPPYGRPIAVATFRRRTFVLRLVQDDARGAKAIGCEVGSSDTLLQRLVLLIAFVIGDRMGGCGQLQY